jgi:hypothetical protein
MMSHPTIDVKEDEEQPRTAVEVMRDSIGLYEKKNDDYADSWRLVGKTIELWLEHHGEEELTIPANEYALNSFGLFTRRLDKMLRAFNGWFLTDEMKVSESIVETQEDSVPYAAMHTQLAEEYSKLDFSEFKDEDTR